MGGGGFEKTMEKALEAGVHSTGEAIFFFQSFPGAEGEAEIPKNEPGESFAKSPFRYAIPGTNSEEAEFCWWCVRTSFFSSLLETMQEKQNNFNAATDEGEEEREREKNPTTYQAWFGENGWVNFAIANLCRV